MTVGHTHRDDFNSISKAIESSPRHSWAEDGYYVIYVRSGVYKEYVRIPYDRKHVLLLGDGIGKTIITGNRSHHDGWTTYHSATFGEKIAESAEIIFLLSKSWTQLQTFPLFT